MNEMTVGTVSVDRVGRMVLPVAARRALGLRGDEPLEARIDLEAGVITLRRKDQHCLICEGTAGLKTYRGVTLCTRCLRRLAKEGGEQCEPECSGA